MGALGNIVLGGIVVLGVTILLSRTVGDDAEVGDLVLVPVRSIDTSSASPILTRLLSDSAGRRDVSVVIRVSSAENGALRGRVIGGANSSGTVDLLPAEMSFETRAPRSAVIGIMKRGAAIAAKDNRLEKGSFAEVQA